jgi:hypothetical protein
MQDKSKMYTLESIRERLQHCKPKAVSEAAGVKYQTLLLLLKDEERDPSYSTVKALSDYLDNWQ